MEACATFAGPGKERGDENGAAQVDGRKDSRVDGESSLGDSASLGDETAAAQVDGRKDSRVDGESSLGDSASLGDETGKHPT
jgi:hypothetical protein